MKNIYITVQKNFSFLRRFDRENSFWNIEKSNRQTCFQMTLNTRKSYADSFFFKIKPMISELDFREIHKTLKNSTAKSRNFGL